MVFSRLCPVSCLSKHQFGSEPSEILNLRSSINVRSVKNIPSTVVYYYCVWYVFLRNGRYSRNCSLHATLICTKLGETPNPHMFFESIRNFKISFVQSVLSYLERTFKSDLFLKYLCRQYVKVAQNISNLWRTIKYQLHVSNELCRT